VTQSTRELDPRDARLSHLATYAARDLEHSWRPCTRSRDPEAVPPIPVRCGKGARLAGYEGKRPFPTLNNRHRGRTLGALSVGEAPVYREPCPPLVQVVMVIATECVDRTCAP
jgi:adenosylmethionine-8-amino-7-oxononanoate aminotransferase